MPVYEYEWLFDLENVTMKVKVTLPYGTMKQMSHWLQYASMNEMYRKMNKLCFWKTMPHSEDIWGNDWPWQRSRLQVVNANDTCAC